MSLQFACIFAAGAALVAASSALAEQKMTLDAAARTRAVEGVGRCLREGYVFPEVGLKMEKAIREKAAAGAFDRIVGGEELAAALTKELQAVNHDRHVRVSYSPERLPPIPISFRPRRRRSPTKNGGGWRVRILGSRSWTS